MTPAWEGELKGSQGCIIVGSLREWHSLGVRRARSVMLQVVVCVSVSDLKNADSHFCLSEAEIRQNVQST